MLRTLRDSDCPERGYGLNRLFRQVDAESATTGGAGPAGTEQMIVRQWPTVGCTRQSGDVCVAVARAPISLLVRDQMLTTGATRMRAELGRFPQRRTRARAEDRSLANRVVHNRFWHENAWL